MHDTKKFLEIKKGIDVRNIGCLYNCDDYSSVPKVNGVYYVFTKNPIKCSKKSLNRIPYCIYEDKIPYYKHEYLIKKLKLSYKDNNQILYIGFGQLRSRISSLTKMVCQNKRTKHKGGIALNSLKKYASQIYVCWFKTDKSEYESNQLIEFSQNNGYLPFANFSVNKPRKHFS